MKVGDVFYFDFRTTRPYHIYSNLLLLQTAEISETFSSLKMLESSDLWSSFKLINVLVLKFTKKRYRWEVYNPIDSLPGSESQVKISWYIPVWAGQFAGFIWT